MAITFLGIDVSDKSTSELQHVNDVLRLSELSNESINMIGKFPEEMRKSWIDNPDSAGEFNDDIVKSLYSSLEKNEPKTEILFENDTAMQAICYSDDVSDIVHRLNKAAYDKACGSYESSIDRQAWHYNYFNDAFKAEVGTLLSDDAFNAMLEQVVTGHYDMMRENYIAINPVGNDKNQSNKSVFSQEAYEQLTKANTPAYESKANLIGRSVVLPESSIYRTLIPIATVDSEIVEGGKFIVSQPAGSNMNYGSYLQSKITDITDTVGDELGLPDSKKQSIFISQSIRTGMEGNDGNAFVVVFTDIPANDELVVKKAIINEIRNVSPNEPFILSDTMPITNEEVQSASRQYSNESLGLNISGKSNAYKLPSVAINEIEHAKGVIDGYDAEQSQYNEDGFDSTGHSADGDYNAMYDSAYTDGGPDL